MNKKTAYTLGTALVFLALFGSDAFAAAAAAAAGGGPGAAAFGNFMTSICSVANNMRGLVGFGVIIVLVVIAAIGIAMGDSKGKGAIISAIIGGVLLASVPAIVGIAGATSGMDTAKCVNEGKFVKAQ